MSAPRVSVIVPTHNGERFLAAALDSVLAQEREDMEIIVVDDASTDRTKDVLQRYASRVTVVERHENSGTADIPRYDGIERAKGEYCALLDADDLWLPGKIRRQVEFMDAHPDVALCHSYVMVTDDTGRDLYVRHENAIPPTGMIAKPLLQHCFISTSSVMVRRDAWLAAQRREDITGYGTEWDFFIAIARKHPIGFLPEVLAKYRHTTGSVSRRRWRRTPRDIGAKERVLRKRLWKGVVSRREMRATIADAALEGSQYWRDCGYPGRAAWFSLKALQYDWLRPRAWASLAKSLLRAFFRTPVTSSE